MATLTTLANRARIKARDTDKLLLTDANLLILANDLNEEIYETLKNVESNLVYAEADISAVDGTREYTAPTGFNGFMDDGVWLDGEEWFMRQVTEDRKVAYDYATAAAESEPEVYYITEDNKVGFLPVPDTSYTVHTQYWKSLTLLTALGDTFPWFGIWDKYFTERLVTEMLLIQERDPSGRAIVMAEAHKKAMAHTYQRGTRNRGRIATNFFVKGV